MLSKIIKSNINNNNIFRKKFFNYNNLLSRPIDSLSINSLINSSSVIL
jgi:hypothetical protein